MADEVPHRHTQPALGAGHAQGAACFSPCRQTVLQADKNDCANQVSAFEEINMLMFKFHIHDFKNCISRDVCVYY